MSKEIKQVEQEYVIISGIKLTVSEATILGAIGAITTDE